MTHQLLLHSGGMFTHLEVEFDSQQHKPTQHNDDVNYDDGMGEIACMKMLSSIFVRKQPRNVTMDVCYCD